LEHLEDSNALDFNVIQEVDPKDVVVVQEQEGNEIDGIYVLVLDHMLGDTQILQKPSQTKLVDVGNKSVSNSDGTMVVKKWERVEDGNYFPKAKKVQGMVGSEMFEDDGANALMDNIVDHGNNPPHEHKEKCIVSPQDVEMAMVVHGDALVDGVVGAGVGTIVTPSPPNKTNFLASPPP
jgi:hypothetical protein